MENARIEILGTILNSCKILDCMHNYFNWNTDGQASIPLKKDVSAQRNSKAMWSQEDSAKEIITVGNCNFFLDDIANLLNASSLSEKVRISVYDENFTMFLIACHVFYQVTCLWTKAQRTIQWSKFLHCNI